MPSGGKREGAGRKSKNTKRFGVSVNASVFDRYGLRELRKLIHEFIKTLE